ncbi:MAG: GtrA family protein [Patescibacteria group bacterium]|nr:GtrA family protein [Patescibacteria group bacterium]
MKHKLHSALQRPLTRYVLIGGSVYVLELFVIVAAQRKGASAVTAVALSFSIGLLVSFVLQKVLAFKDRRTHHKILIPQIIAFILLVLWNFSFTLLLTKALESHLQPVITRTMALGITTVWNFYLYKTHIFSNEEITG